jgi:ribonuclease Z
VAGLETCIEVPQLKLLLDLGSCSRTAVNQSVVLLSHGHLDHMGAVAQHAARRSLLGMSEATYVVPRRIASQVEDLFNAAGRLDGQAIARRVVALEPGEEHALGKGRVVRAFETYHRVPSQGYTVWETRSRLLPEFRDLPGIELGKLRRSGAVLDARYQAALLSFTGDTRVDVLERSADLAHSECLVIECSFLDELIPTPRAREMGHIHLDELIARADLLSQPDIVLSHFSARYDTTDVARLLQRKLPDQLQERVRILTGPTSV